MKQCADLINSKFGMLEVVAEANKIEYSKQKSSAYLCVCDCLKVVKVNRNDLTKRKFPKRSCGCLSLKNLVVRNKKHGLSQKGRRASEYYAWVSMKARCFNPNVPNFKNYGARGITVCDRWLKFEKFLEDMGTKNSSELSLDRIDNNGNYEPGNCRWATQEEQHNNTRRNTFFEYKGQRLTLAEISRRTGVDVRLIRYRVAHGWSIEDAGTKPARVRSRD